ncbi:hypothetical protein GOARA_043_00040 [Gordonia araii NBRC 100433]|uniref:Uncharacterized protein n=2 Tax=Gordonia araii TaxID=263909 RepID=G7H169_9ACTN|nr:hypothetical protein GOARA_043_00040 [Gordonia araii NBRC 100433]
MILTTLLGACVKSPEEVPAMDISRAELWRTINQNLHAVDPDWVVTPWPDTLVRRYGCATNPESHMPMGPPWRYEVSQWKSDPSPEYLARVREGLDALARRGFEVGPPPKVDDPRDLAATDSRGFSVSVRFTQWTGEPLRVDIKSWSPCVRHPGEVDDW